MTSGRLPSTPHRHQGGAFGVLYAIMLPVMLGMVGLAIDLSMVYARGHELQAVADGAALAAARALDGTQAGLEAARANAASVARKAEYRFLNAETIEWSPAALRVGPSRNGPWIAADSVSTLELPRMFFAQVDTGELDPVYGRIAVAFLRVVGVDPEQNLARRAVAGRRDTLLAPIAVCALNKQPLSMRSNAPAANAEEAIEYGFRRGVGYNLLNLNPNGATPRSFMINPLDFAPAPALASHHSDDAVRPFVCSGEIPAPPLEAGATLYVREPFPAAMAIELNSRFGQYPAGSTCTKFGSPPDFNIIDFRGGYPAFWVNGGAQPTRGSAEPYLSGAGLATVADAEPLPGGTTAASYGTLWAFSRPLRYTAGEAGEPFTRNDWSRLYPVTAGPNLSSSYPQTVSPYDRNASPHRQLPTPLSGVWGRRVLNVPLLDCPVSGSSARMLGIARFLMTTPASAAPAAIHAEFGGMTTYGKLAASAVLFK